MTGVDERPGVGQGYTPPPPTVPPPPGLQYPAEVPAVPSGPARAPLRRLGRRSLTSRLVVGVVSLVVVLVLIISGSTYFALKSFLYQRLDQQVTSVVSSNSGHLQRCLQYSIPKCQLGDGVSGFRAPQTEWIAVVSDTGGYLAGVDIEESESLKRLRLPSSTFGRALNTPESALPVTTTDGHRLRVSAQEVPTPQGNVFVVSGLSTDEVQRTLHRLLFLDLTIGAIAVVIALFTTSFGVRFSLRRLRRVTTTAQEVAAELSPEGAGLERRVPDDEPDTEVGQLATSFNTMLAAVELQFAARLESEQRMRQFLADASHELRTPLTSIRGYAELARMKRAVGGYDDDSSDNLDRIESEGTRMSRLVEDLLMLARGDADDARPLDRELIDVSQLVDDAVSGARAAFPAREFTIDFDGEAHVVGDPDQLLRAIRNLVTNSAVHTHVDRPIVVRSHADHRGVTIEVIDGGPGLAPQDAAHVFERFWRADKARTRARGGSGLGLSIVATIVRSHGGQVRFDSTVERGSTVTIWLPGVEHI